MRRLQFFVRGGTLLTAGLALAAFSGCVSTAPLANFAEVEVGESVEGRPVRATIVTGESLFWDESAVVPEAATGADRETVLLFAAIHGNETLTSPLLDRLVERVRIAPEIAFGKRLVIVPVANPDGLARRRRGNANGVDLNRNFPSRNWRRRGRTHGVTPASEPETRILMELVERFAPSRILSVHAPLHCVDHDGPAGSIARALGDASGYDVKQVGYPTPGSFGSWAGVDRRIPVITLEMRRDIRRAELWSELGPALLAFVRYPEELAK